MPHNMAMNLPMPMANKSGIHDNYLAKTMPILNEIVEQNPNYK